MLKTHILKKYVLIKHHSSMVHYVWHVLMINIISWPIWNVSHKSVWRMLKLWRKLSISNLKTWHWIVLTRLIRNRSCLLNHVHRVNHFLMIRIVFHVLILKYMTLLIKNVRCLLWLPTFRLLMVLIISSRLIKIR